MRKRWRWSLLALAAAGAAIAAMHLRQSNQRAATAVVEPTAQRYQFTALPPRESLRRAKGDLFAPRSWAPPPAPPPPAPVVPQAIEAAPAPPPNPYRFVGTVLYNGRLEAVLAKGDRIYLARKGDPLEHDYRVESVTRDAVTLVYSPLGTPVTLALAAEASAASGGSPPPVLK